MQQWAAMQHCRSMLRGAAAPTAREQPLYLNSLESRNCTVAPSPGPGNDQVNLQEISSILGHILLSIGRLFSFLELEGYFRSNCVNFTN